MPHMSMGMWQDCWRNLRSWVSYVIILEHSSDFTMAAWNVMSDKCMQIIILMNLAIAFHVSSVIISVYMKCEDFFFNKEVQFKF